MNEIIHNILHNPLTDYVLFYFHMVVLLFGGFWSYKLIKLSPTWKHIWLLFIGALFGSALRRFMVTIYPDHIQSNDLVVLIVIDFIPSLVLLSMGIGLMLLYSFLSKHIDEEGKLK